MEYNCNLCNCSINLDMIDNSFVLVTSSYVMTCSVDCKEHDLITFCQNNDGVK